MLAPDRFKLWLQGLQEARFKREYVCVCCWTRESRGRPVRCKTAGAPSAICGAKQVATESTLMPEEL
eukprot:6005314-Alexandrium_andersonii.AAC.1